MASSAPYMIRSATDFLPRVISTFMNLATSSLLCFGAGRISRLGTSLRRGIGVYPMNVAFDELMRPRSRGLGPLGPVLGARLLAILHAGGVEAAANHVVAHARQVLHAPAADQHHRMLLEVGAFAADVADDLVAVREAHLGDLAQRRVGLLRRRGVDARAHPALLRAA